MKQKQTKKKQLALPKQIRTHSITKRNDNSNERLIGNYINEENRITLEDDTNRKDIEVIH